MIFHVAKFIKLFTLQLPTESKTTGELNLINVQALKIMLNIAHN